MHAPADAPAEGKIELEAPETVVVGRRAYRCGGVTFRVIRHVVEAAGHASTLPALAADVWGRTIGAEVSKSTVKMAVSRANVVLEGLGARERLTIDKDVILLV